MRRTDRLFDLIQTLRDGRLHRAAQMAAQTGVSERTIWRDMAVLMESGMPIEGERGVGYILRAPLTLPPMMITAAELQALRAGLHSVVAGGDVALARAAKTLAGKVAAVTPRPAQPDELFANTRQKPSRSPPHIPLLRRAIRARLRVTISHIQPHKPEAHGDMRPLYLDLKSTVWTLIAYCESQNAFRVLRLDSILAVRVTAEVFAKTQGCELADYRSLCRA